MPILWSHRGGGAARPRAILAWRRRLGLIAALLALAVALPVVPIWCSTLIAVAWSDPWLRYRAVQSVFVGYHVALVAAPIGLVGATAAGLRARRRGRERSATRAGRACLACLGILIGLGLCEALSAWRLRSLTKLAHPSALAGVAKGPAPARPVPKEAAGPNKGLAGSGAPAKADGDPIRIVIIGGSSAKGFPFESKMSLDRLIAWQIGRAFPGRRVVAENLAERGLTLAQAIDRLDGLEHRPDLLIVYSGNNEFQSRFGWMRKVPYYPVEAKVPPPTFAQRMGRWTGATDLLGRTLDRFEAALAPVERVEVDPVDSPCGTPEEYAAVLADYRRRLDALLGDCEAAGILSMVVLPPSNEGAFDPNRSILPPSMKLAERRAFVAKLDAIREVERADPARAIAEYRLLIDEQPGFAEAHFRLARLLRAEGSIAEAREEFLRARDLDAFPIRCSTPYLDACREVGARRGSLVLDAPRLLALASPDGIVDDRFFDDAHHPGVNAVALMAREAIGQLRARGAFGWPADVHAPEFTMGECIARFGLDQQVWIDLCWYSRRYYETIRFGRHDPSFRDALMARYDRAVQRLEAGTPPEQAGIPALRIHEELRAGPPGEGPAARSTTRNRERGPASQAAR